MKELRAYSIPFVGLKQGVHYFEYEIGKDFLEHFPYSPIHDADLQVKLAFNKKEDFLVLNFHLEGTVNVECDRCTEPFDLPIKGENQMIVKFDDSANRGEEVDIIFISRAESEFNVAQLIYEFMNLALPMQKTHPDVGGKSTCNKKIINILRGHDGSKNDDDDIDPRWDALNKLKTN